MIQSADIYDQLTVEWNQLMSIWQDSQIAWTDSVASQFEKRFMSPLETEIPAFLAALEALRDELRDAGRERD